MARKRAPGFEAQREDILAAAARLFAEQGFSATSMNQVAEACGVAKPTLYHYFQDKQELLAQICDSHVHALLALVEEIKAQQLAPDAQLRAADRALHAVLCRRPGPAPRADQRDQVPGGDRT